MMSGSEGYSGPDSLRVGDGTCLRISSVGHASISSNSRSLSLRDVLHVPALTNSLLSVRRFATGNDVFFEFHSSCFFMKDRVTKKVLLKGGVYGGLYSLPSVAPVAF